MTTPTEDAAAARRPRWGLIGIIAAATIVVAVIALVVVRSFLSTPHPPLGVTAVEDLQLGSCLEENTQDAPQYTVVDCRAPHPQQVVGSIDLSISTASYTHFESMAIYAQEVCDRYLEYGLFVPERIASVQVRDSYELLLLGMPTEEQYDAGPTTAFCAIRAVDGSPLTEDLHEPLPG